MKSKQIFTEDVLSRARKIKLLLMDCDGVLTDGKLYFSANGEELKVFHVRDGQGLVDWHKKGYVSGIISGRNSEIVKKRATELNIKYVKIGSRDKVKDLEEISADAKVSYKEIAFVGDDLPDIDVLRLVGLPIAVADAEVEVMNESAYITKAKGGLGAIREVVNLLNFAKS
jgi:3-deoxy-D-manno-octulosonate 8-phosphate phosphatase (KDO 8-P phosphatase)